jgi:GT2 family glycosyltransferase
MNNQSPLASGGEHPAADAAETAEEQSRDTEIASGEDELAIKGYFESLSGTEVIGWAVEGKATVCEVQVLVDDCWAAGGVAGDFRAHLLEAGIGTGCHGFRIALPEDYLDGQVHRVRVQAGPRGDTLPPGEREFVHRSVLRGEVEKLDGDFVSGWVLNAQAPDEPVSVELLLDGKTVATGQADRHGNNGMRFAMRLPAVAMDGRPHRITVRSIMPQELIGELGVITPMHRMPDDAQRRFSGSSLNAALLQGAALRYEALRRSIARIAADLDTTIKTATASEVAASAAERLLQLHIAHEQVVLGFDASGEPKNSNRERPVLHFPEVQQPDVSIVIPVHNKFEVTYHCLASLLLAPNLATFEVIIVDDGSSDSTVNLAGQVKGIQILRHDVSQGFVHSCNSGGKLARGRYIVMLNNDTEVTLGWIDELLHVFEHFDGVGMAGAKLLYPNGTLQEAGGIVWNNGDPWNYGRDGNPHEPRYNYTRQVDYISGACLMLPTPLWTELGGFDEHFAPAYFEDTDLAFRVRERGLKTVYTPFSQVIHFEGISSGTSITSGAKRYQKVNEPKFKKRWASAVRGNGVFGKEVDLAKDRNVRFRVLVIDANAPRPDIDAGSYAAIQEMRLLQSLGCKLTFMSENPDWAGGYTQALQRAGIECLYAPFMASVNEVVEKRGAEFDLVYITRYWVAERHLDAIRLHAPQAKIVFNNADLHFLRELRTAIAARSKDGVSHALQTRDVELAVMRKVDLVLSYNEIEHAVIQSHNLDSTKVAKCPWVVSTRTDVATFEARDGIAFLGAYQHHPNVEAAESFVREVMPLLRERLPGVELRLYGSDMPQSLRDLLEGEDDVALPGWVVSVDEVYDNSRVFVAPLLSGAGIKGKVIGAMAHGVPCVVSPVAAEGTGIRNGLEALVATTPAQWVDAIELLYNDRDAWSAQQRAAWAYTESEFTLARGRELMQAALEMADIFAVPDASCLVHDSGSGVTK